MKKNKIVMVTGSYPPARCGVGDYTSHICGIMASMGADITVITSSFHSIKKTFSPVKVLPVISSWHNFNSKNILKTITDEKPSVVHFQYPNLEYKKNLSFNFLPGMIKKADPSIKIVQTFHEPIKELSILGRIRFMINMRHADGLIFVEKENYNTLPFYLKNCIKNKSVSFIPIGSNIPAVKRDLQLKKKIFNKLKIDTRLKLITTFGFITPVKGYESLLEVYDPKKEFWVHIGTKDKKEPYYGHFLKLAKAQSKLDNIYFTGELPAKQAAVFLASSDACVFPFKEGATPRHGTFLAAAAQGGYVIASHAVKRGYFKEYNIYYIEPQNQKELRRAMDFKSTVKKTSLPLVPSWEKITKKHISFYREISGYI